MNTIIYAIADGKALLPDEEWEMSGNWAYFKDADNLSIEIKFVGKDPWYKFFRKTPKRLWVDEFNVKLVYWNQVEVEE